MFMNMHVRMYVSSGGEAEAIMNETGPSPLHVLNPQSMVLGLVSLPGVCPHSLFVRAQVPFYRLFESKTAPLLFLVPESVEEFRI